MGRARSWTVRDLASFPSPLASSRLSPRRVNSKAVTQSYGLGYVTGRPECSGHCVDLGLQLTLRSAFKRDGFYHRADDSKSIKRMLVEGRSSTGGHVSRAHPQQYSSPFNSVCGNRASGAEALGGSKVWLRARCFAGRVDCGEDVFFQDRRVAHHACVDD